MIINTFKRYEIKYSASEEQFNIIKEELMKHMTLDKHCAKTGSYMIYNLYFDIDSDDIIKQSLSKPYYKEKLRLRSYKMPTSGDDLVFLELKKKIGGIVSKRRATMTYAEAMHFVDTGILPIMNNYSDRQMMYEIEDFLYRYPAKPKVFISYERTAFFDSENTEFRVSFDKNIITRRNQVNLVDGDFGSELMDDDLYLMEIKLSTQIPLWLCELLSSMGIYSKSFSKYGNEYKQYIKQKAIPRIADTSKLWKNRLIYDYTKLTNIV